jgi:hypothetical protein
MGRIATWWAAVALVAPGVSRAEGARGGLEGSVGLLTTLSQDEIRQHQLLEIDQSVGPALALSPTVEWPLGRTVLAGADTLFLLTENRGAPGDDDRRLLVAAHGRLRLSYRLFPPVALDVLLGLGVGTWTGYESPLCIARRIGFGAGVPVSDDLELFASFSHYRTYNRPLVAFVEDAGLGEPDFRSFATILLTVGVRARD